LNVVAPQNIESMAFLNITLQNATPDGASFKNDTMESVALQNASSENDTL
jgi:hypothetical protein